MERDQGTRTGPRSPVRRSQLAVLVAACALVLTGCLDGEIDVKVNGDGSGRIVVEVFPTPQVMAVIEDVDIDAALDGSFTGVDGFDFSEVERDGRDGYRLEVPFDDYRDVVPILIEGGAVLGEQVVLFSSFALTELDDDGWQLSADINPIAPIVIPDPGGPLAGVDELVDALNRSGSSTVELSVSLPGKVVSSNADRSDGGTATWVLDRADAPPQLRVRTEPTSFPTPLQLVLGGAALIILLGIVFALAGARRPYQRTESDRVRRQRTGRGGTSTGPSTGPSPWAPPGRVAEPVASAPQGSTLPTLPAFPTHPDGPPVAAVPPTPAVSTPSPTPVPDSGPSAGWYPDPEDPQRTRWWDGDRWTDRASTDDPG